MRDDLLYHYERELTYLRRLGAEFGKKYPKVAARLQLEPGKCEDPHVERLLEGFAFLTARVQLRLEDDFSEVSEALLGVVNPNYVRPVPSMSIVQFEQDPKLTKGFPLPRGTMIHSRPVGGAPCKFRTCYDTTLWPITVADAQWTTPDRLKPAVKSADAVAAIRLELRGLPDVTFDKLDLNTLRFHLSGETNLVSTLYEVMANNCVQVLVRDPTSGTRRRPIALTPAVLQPVGFGPDEMMLPVSRRSFSAYGLLQEYFTFPEKFMFFDLSGFDQVRAAGFAGVAEIVLLISQFERSERRQLLETSVNAGTFRLGCSPVVNLFPQTSEPVALTHQKHEYLIVPDARRRSSTEIFSVDEVLGSAAAGGATLKFEPLYSYRHAHGAGQELFWNAVRRPSGWRLDAGSDVFISFADLEGRTQKPGLTAVTCRLTCFNADLPARLPFSADESDFELPGGGPVRRITSLVKPTSVIQPPLGKPQLWRLVSMFALKYTALLEAGSEGLQELLRLFNSGDGVVGERQIQGIQGMKGSPCFSRVTTDHGIAFARGHRVELDFDEEQFAGGGLFLFASVLERFLGLYASLNSFSQLVVRSQQRKLPLREWAPRAGWTPLI
jgi:type VI secretion system protein ImpG